MTSRSYAAVASKPAPPVPTYVRGQRSRQIKQTQEKQQETHTGSTVPQVPYEDLFPSISDAVTAPRKPKTSVKTTQAVDETMYVDVLVQGEGFSKLQRKSDGKIAVIYHPLQGTGWSSRERAEIAFDSRVARHILSKKPVTPAFLSTIFTSMPLVDDHLDGLVVEWLTPGTLFTISDSGTGEVITIHDPLRCMTA